MTALLIILWALAILTVAIFLHDYFIPFIKVKFMFWRMSKRISRMSKKHEGETRKQLKSIAEGLMDLSKNTKIDDDED